MMGTFAFSMESPKCKRCKYRDDCKNKRLVACMYIDPMTSSAAEGASQSAAESVVAPHEYRTVTIDGTKLTVDLVKMKKQAENDFYRALGCGFLGGG